MYKQIPWLAAGLIACAPTAWAATLLPTNETYSAAADIGTNFFSPDPLYVPLLDFTTTPGATAQISGPGYTASASTDLGSNHAYASASAFPTGAFGIGSFSGWYDQVTISGGTGTGTAHFTVQLSGTADVGAFAGGLAYGLGTSTLHPTQLASDLLAFSILSGVQPWPMDAVNPIASYLLGASPYNDTSILFPDPSTLPTSGIPAVIDPSYSLGGGAGVGFPAYDLILTPGAGQTVNITLHGTLNFTYDEAFYLIGGVGTSATDGLASFCAFDISGACTPPTKDGTGATTLDFSNSANLVNIALPEGATASFASGAAYNVTAVPEPGEWLMLLAGLGLVGWRARRRA